MANSTRENISYLLSPDQLIADCRREIEISPNRTKIARNMKFDNGISQLRPGEALSLRHDLGSMENDPILLRLVRWPKEKEILNRIVRKC
jgi:hypothetical protein